MRAKEEKCKRKGQETTIGKIIYGFLLFLPLLAIGVTCGYAIFNKNAYQSYADYVDTQTTEVSLNSALINGQTYYVNITGTNLNAGYTYQVLDYQTNAREVYAPNDTWKVSRFQFEMSSGRKRLIIYDENNQQHNYFDQNKGFYFVSNGVNTMGTNATWYTITTLSYTQAKISEVFYYSIDRVQQSPLFNWAENSFVYTTTASTCTQLHITSTFIPLLFSYWLIMSVIYFLFDIALMLMWTIHKKIHQLQESI